MLRRAAKHLLIIGVVVLIISIASHYILLSITRHSAQRTVPTLTGLTLDYAEELARANDLKLHINDSLYVPQYEGGVVLEQLPNDGIKVKPGRTIYITINAFKGKILPVPYVAERSLRQANNSLNMAGFEIKEIIYVPDMATNYVLEEYLGNEQIEPSSKVMAEMGSGITLHVGLAEGTPPTLTPNVLGLTLKQAKDKIWNSGLNVGRVSFDDGVDKFNENIARVYIQSTLHNNKINWGEKINISITNDTSKVDNAIKSAEAAEKEEAELRELLEKSIADSLAKIDVIPTTTEQSDIDFDNFFE